MSKRIVVKASKNATKRRTVQASRSTEDMLNAFEAKLAEFGIESSTEVEACGDYPVAASEDLDGRSVEIYEEDWDEKFKDVGGGFDADGEILTLGEIKEYWNDNNLGDPVLAEYDDFESWFRDTRDNFLEEC